MFSSGGRALRLRRIAVALRERYVDAVIKANLASSNCRHGRDIGNQHSRVRNRCSMPMWLRLRHDGKRKRHNNYDNKLLHVKPPLVEMPDIVPARFW